MQDRYLVTLEIETYDGDPRAWDWGTLLGHEDEVKVIETQYKGRVLPEEDSNE